jgi:DNA-binding beta-propeller fold protein YncE
MAMRKKVAVLFGLVFMMIIAGCGGDSSTTATTIYDVPTPVPIPTVPTSRINLGGAIQGVGALPFNNYSVTTFAGSSAGFSNHTSATDVSAKFNRPIAVTSDGANLYVADYLNNAIRKIVIASKLVTTIAAVDANGVAASFNLPSGITTDGTNLYVADSGNFTIRKIDLSTGVVTTLAGAVGASGSVDAPIGTNARFNVLNGITTDGKNLYVTDSNNTIRRIDLANNGAVSTLAGAPGTSGSTDGAQAAARFNQPARITCDGPNLYVTDFGNNTIRKIVLETGAVTTIAGKVGPGGAAGSHADSADTGLNARFNQPNGITTDGLNLYVTDSYDNTVRQIVLSHTKVFSGTVTTIAGTAGIAGLTDAKKNAARFNTPMDITTDGTSLFIADIENHRIRQIQQ